MQKLRDQRLEQASSEKQGCQCKQDTIDNMTKNNEFEWAGVNGVEMI